MSYPRTFQPHQLPSTKAEKAALGEQFAEQMLYYTKIQVTTCDILRATDPLKFDKMLHEQKDVQPASGAEVRDLDPNSFGDQVFAVLKQYDEYIEQEPKTFEQHFARMQMAFSAFILFNCHVLQPLLYNKEFSRLYHKSFTLRYDKLLAEHLVSRSRAAATSSSSHFPENPTTATKKKVQVGEKVMHSHTQALIQDYQSLMDHEFISEYGTPDEGQWRVNCANLQRNKSTRFEISFDLGTMIRMTMATRMVVGLC